MWIHFHAKLDFKIDYQANLVKGQFVLHMKAEDQGHSGHTQDAGRT